MTTMNLSEQGQSQVDGYAWITENLMLLQENIIFHYLLLIRCWRDLLAMPAIVF